MMSQKRMRAIAKYDRNITNILEYTDGFVANAYYWPAPGIGHVYHINAKGDIEKRVPFTYDKKRSASISHSEWIAQDEEGGKVISENKYLQRKGFIQEAYKRALHQEEMRNGR